MTMETHAETTSRIEKTSSTNPYTSAPVQTDQVSRGLITHVRHGASFGWKLATSANSHPDLLCLPAEHGSSRHGSWLSLPALPPSPSPSPSPSLSPLPPSLPRPPFSPCLLLRFRSSAA